MVVIWSPAAVDDYQNNIIFLQNHWGKVVTENFISATTNCIEHLKQFPTMYPVSRYRNVRCATVVKQISILYTLENNQITLLRFWNNLQDPTKDL